MSDHQVNKPNPKSSELGNSPFDLVGHKVKPSGPGLKGEVTLKNLHT